MKQEIIADAINEYYESMRKMIARIYRPYRKQNDKIVKRNKKLDHEYK